MYADIFRVCGAEQAGCPAAPLPCGSLWVSAILKPTLTAEVLRAILPKNRNGLTTIGSQH